MMSYMDAETRVRSTLRRVLHHKYMYSIMELLKFSKQNVTIVARRATNVLCPKNLLKTKNFQCCLLKILPIMLYKQALIK